MSNNINGFQANLNKENLTFPTENILNKARYILDNRHESDYTLDDAIEIIEQAVRAEDQERYYQAIELYLNGGEKLSKIAELEPDSKIQNLLRHKAHEIISWSERIAKWIESVKSTTISASADSVYPKLPPRRAQTVAIKSGDNPSPEQTSHNGINEVEAINMYYTPITIEDPIEFSSYGYRLQCINNGREPKLMIVVTMYNEEPSELEQTLRKIANNVQYLSEKRLPGYDGKNGFKNILVCIVSDGRKKANPKTLDYLKNIGLYDEDLMTIVSAGMNVQCHLFEHTVQLTKSSKYDSSSSYYPPLQVVYALKENNSGKLNSHLWYFNAFAEQLQPDYTLLLDVGTLPTKKAFYKLLSAMSVNENLGGCCGEIAVSRPLPLLYNFVVASQHFEYKISNIMDKAMESVFGFISVLPGAFSAYRYEAIRGEPLKAYFKSLTTATRELGPFEGNMYLAEDRILCFEIVAQRGRKWELQYIKNAIARTDVPTNLLSLISQRRRWLNGSFFASLFAIIHWDRIYRNAKHSCMKKFLFFIQYVYNLLMLIFTWVLPSNFYLTIYYLIGDGFINKRTPFTNVESYVSDKDDRKLITNGVQAMYGCLIFLQIIYGLGNKPKHMKGFYSLLSFLYGIMMLGVTVITVWIFISDPDFEVQGILMATLLLGVFAIASLLHLELHHILLSVVQYIAMIPTYVNILPIYSFCNLQDLSWGTKGLEQSHNATNSKISRKKNGNAYTDVLNRKKHREYKENKDINDKDLLKKRFDTFRSNLLITWIGSNIIYLGAVSKFIDAELFLLLISLFIGGFNGLKFIGSMLYLIHHSGQSFLFNCLLCCGILKKRHERRNSQPQLSIVTGMNSSSYATPSRSSSIEAHYHSQA